MSKAIVPTVVDDASQIEIDGVYRLPNDAYHAGKGISSSNLKHLLRSPAHYQAAKKDQKTTPAMEFGTLVHTFYLEPELFESEYVVEPELGGPKTKQPWKGEWEAFKKSVKGRKVVKVEDYQKACHMIANAHIHPYASQIKLHCDTEVSAYVHETDICLKARADLIDYKNGFIWDVKTTLDARENEFSRAIGNFKYHLSAAYYLAVFTQATGRKFDKFGWIVIEKTSPFSVSTYIADPYMLEVGRKEVLKALRIYRECLANDSWPGYKGTIETISLPKYYNVED